MKEKQTWINILIYIIVILGITYLYFPLNNNPENQPKSKIQFVYQQF